MFLKYIFFKNHSVISSYHHGNYLHQSTVFSQSYFCIIKSLILFYYLVSVKSICILASNLLNKLCLTKEKTYRTINNTINYLMKQETTVFVSSIMSRKQFHQVIKYEHIPLSGHISYFNFIHGNKEKPETGTSKIAKITFTR